MSLSENLQNLRKIKNMSQEELAEKLNVSRQAVSKWESGNGYPETEKIQKYLNESEIAVVNSGECVYDYVIINFNDLDSFLKKNDN